MKTSARHLIGFLLAASLHCTTDPCHAAGIVLTKDIPSQSEEFWKPAPYTTIERFTFAAVIYPPGGGKVTISNAQVAKVFDLPDLTKANLVTEGDLVPLKTLRAEIAAGIPRYKASAAALTALLAQVDTELSQFAAGNVLLSGKWVSRAEYDKRIREAAGSEAKTMASVEVRGNTLRNVRVTAVNGDRISLLHDGGMLAVSAQELKAEDLKRLQWLAPSVFPKGQPVAAAPQPTPTTGNAPAPASAPPVGRVTDQRSLESLLSYGNIPFGKSDSELADLVGLCDVHVMPIELNVFFEPFLDLAAEFPKHQDGTTGFLQDTTLELERVGKVLKAAASETQLSVQKLQEQLLGGLRLTPAARESMPQRACLMPLLTKRYRSREVKKLSSDEDKYKPLLNLGFDFELDFRLDSQSRTFKLMSVRKQFRLSKDAPRSSLKDAFTLAAEPISAKLGKQSTELEFHGINPLLVPLAGINQEFSDYTVLVGTWETDDTKAFLVVRPIPLPGLPQLIECPIIKELFYLSLPEWQQYLNDFAQVQAKGKELLTGQEKKAKDESKSKAAKDF